MNHLQIEIDSGQTEFLPGQTLSGTAQWQLEKDPKKAEIRLYWFTQGKGTEDSSLVEEKIIDNPMQNDSTRFEFALPVGPHSFSGKLISLIWAVELIVNKKSASQTFTLSPTGQEILLSETSRAYS